MKQTMINRFYKAIICGLLSVFAVSGMAQNLPLIPYPAQLTKGQGEFLIKPNTLIVNRAGRRFINEIDQLNELLKKGFGKKLVVAANKAAAQSFVIAYDASIRQAEGYQLLITPKQVKLSAKDGAGMFRAVQTIRQLLPAALETGLLKARLTLPAVRIADAPAYGWRGMHLDVSRHFFSINYLKRYIDRLALYKMNKLHLHLTDDQGWRIEIKRYPKLTEIGAWRTFNNQDSVCMERAKDDPSFIIDPQHIVQRDGKTMYGGFYTQQQMKDVVAYAAARHIDIVPEIDMPGHMMAAINAYPYLTCNGENSWGPLFTKPICPCNERTFEFAQNIYTEIMQIFPSKYIHIGGDEVERSDWAKSDACKQLMAQNNIKDLAALQSYFINRMEKFFNAKGRQLIGWDEVLEGGISPTAYVMYWRSWVPNAPIKAAKNGNKVIMTPGNPLYFDAKYDKNSEYNVYHFNPVPKGLNAREATAIIGAQANLWTEYIPSETRADYMSMPRMTALAEALWTNKRDQYDDYHNRLTQQYPRLDALSIKYRLPDLPDMIDTRVFTTTDTLNIASPLQGAIVRYTADGTQPVASSPVLNKYVISAAQKIKVAAFTPNGRRGDIYTIDYIKQALAGPAAATADKNGLKAVLYKGLFNEVAKIKSAGDSTFTTIGIQVPKSITAPSFAVKYKGYINIPADGIYTFFLTCDDGGVLKIANRLVVDNDGLHSAVEKSGQVALKKGLQPFALDFIEGGGGYTLKLQYSINGHKPQDVPPSWFKN
jgi:hexosaminidase